MLVRDCGMIASAEEWVELRTPRLVPSYVQGRENAVAKQRGSSRTISKDGARHWTLSPSCLWAPTCVWESPLRA